MREMYQQNSRLVEKRILFMDDDPEFLNPTAELLEIKGYKVFKANTLNEAVHILDEIWIHFVIVDLNMSGPKMDDLDRSGFNLLSNKNYIGIPKVVVTGYSDMALVQAALRSNANGEQLAVDFLHKSEAKLIDEIAEAFDDHVQFNWDLVIQWNIQEIHTPLHLTNLILTQVDEMQLSDRSLEITDLLRKLFFGKSQITIDRLLIRQDSMVLLEVFTYNDQGRDETFIVCCGQKAEVLSEANLYQEYAPKRQRAGNILKFKTQETIRFAATTYKLVSGNIEEMISFEDGYRSWSVARILKSLEFLFGQTLDPWSEHSNGKTMGLLTEFYSDWAQRTEEIWDLTILDDNIKALCRKSRQLNLQKIKYSTDKLTLSYQNDELTFVNPVTFLSKQVSSYEVDILYGQTPVCLNLKRILVDQSQRTWLIDFSEIQLKPLLAQFVELEAAIKFDLLATHNVLNRYQLEEFLLDQEDQSLLEDGLVDFDPDIQKAISIIPHIRKWAKTILGISSEVYQIGSLFQAIIRLKTYNPDIFYPRRELVKYIHSLLCAMMISDHLNFDIVDPPTTEPLKDGISIDTSNRRVWVLGREVTIRGYQYFFLLRLCEYSQENPTKPYTYEMIKNEVYNEDGPIEYRHNFVQRVYTLVRNVRLKIEPKASDPQFIQTVSDVGYRFAGTCHLFE